MLRFTEMERSAPVSLCFGGTDSFACCVCVFGGGGGGVGGGRCMQNPLPDAPPGKDYNSHQMDFAIEDTLAVPADIAPGEYGA